MELKAGTRLCSAVDATEIIVVRAGTGDVDLRCGGQPMAAMGDAPADKDGPSAGFDSGTALGKRYEDTEVGLEVLCTKAGDGSLSIGDQPLGLKDAKPLPSSD